MARTFIDYDTPNDYEFDPDVIEIANGYASLKQRDTTGEVFYFNFDNGLLSKLGNKSIVLGGANNTGLVSNKWLTFPNIDLSHATIENLTEFSGDFSLRCRIRINDAVVGANQSLIAVKSKINGEMLKLLLQPQGGGVTRIIMRTYDSGGAISSGTVLVGKTLTVGEEIDIALTYNQAQGKSKGYVDGINLGEIVYALTSFSLVDIQLAGDTLAVCDYGNLQAFNTLAFEGGYTSPLPEQTLFSLNAPTVKFLVPLAMDSWAGISSLTEELNSDSVRYVVERNGVCYWHNGAEWTQCLSDLDIFLQSNTIAEIQANVSTFPLSPGISTSIKIVSLLHSNDGYTSPKLEEMTLTYSAQLNSDAITVCNVSGYILDNSGAPISGALVEVDSKDYLNANSLITKKITTVTDSRGKWDISIVETETTSKTVNFLFSYEENGETKVFSRKKLIIPNAVSALFSALVEAQ